MFKKKVVNQSEELNVPRISNALLMNAVGVARFSRAAT